MREYRAQCAGTAPMQQIFYVRSCQARDWDVPTPKDLEVYYEKYKKELEESQRLKNILRMAQVELIEAMRQGCPTLYFSLAQRHLDWLQECDQARSFLSVAADALEANAPDDRPLYAYSEVRYAWSKLSESQRQLFDQGYLTRLVFEQRTGTEAWKRENLQSLRRIIED